MKTSDSLKEISTALAKCQAEIKNPPKNAENPYYKSKYADLSTVIDSIKHIVSKYGLSYISSLEADNELYVLETRVIHSSGEWVSDKIPLIGPIKDMQKLGAAITYARRYSLQNLFGITGDDDDDGNCPVNNQPQVKNNEPKITKPKLDFGTIKNLSLAKKYIDGAKHLEDLNLVEQKLANMNLKGQERKAVVELYKKAREVLDFQNCENDPKYQKLSKEIDQIAKKAKEEKK